MSVKHYRLNGVDVWAYEEDVAISDAALMPTPTHDQDTLGMGMSYAHLTEDGNIWRFREKIATIADLIPMEAA